ncbi:hypothetical protein A3A66_00040 [Microgenomates group bacterium RIFCSPLOWO2_01_FULL_46_13]|nr:MAG: hypothetical protein A2783_02695 [Microgenomates group bacterium RIFCSPHIGHO2_01_FULL_45_11]OGV95208.1 MAG: hypothetical protein A3A66_00040 [Microgenomates group bacterium RIFCSPLOWO2_01_FULL_46_13]
MPKKILVIVITLVLLSQYFLLKSYAAVSSCTASVTPTSTTTSTDQDFTFTVNNTSDTTAVWIKTTRPSSDYEITGYSGSGWGQTFASDYVILTSGTLAASGSFSFTLGITTGATETSSAGWTIQVSDDSGGASPTTCTGSLSTTIMNAPTISSVTVSEITQTQAKISWSTDKETTGEVQYGRTTSYGSTATDSTYSTSHTITLGSLSSDTTYHYKIKTTDRNSQSTETSDNTFAASKTATTVTVTQTTTTTVTKTVADTTLPTTGLKTDFTKIYSLAPEISGTASDDSGVSQVDYSLDDGLNWLPVSFQSAIGKKSITFNFTPTILDDGTYKIRVRVTDPSGNQTVSKAYKLIIDRLPPEVGPSLLSLGPLIFERDAKGNLYTVAGLDQKITLSAIGGANSINLIAEPQTQALSLLKTQAENRVLGADSQVFSLVKNPDSGLWSGTVSFAKEGTYQIVAYSLDDAGNQTERNLGTIIAVPSGLVEGEANVLKEALVTIYTYDPSTKKYSLWSASEWGQANPLPVTTGNYTLILPAGTYLAQISAPGHMTVKTKIFSPDKTTILNSDFILPRKKMISLGPLSITWPSLFSPKPEVNLKGSPLPSQTQSSLIGTELPFLSFKVDDLEFNSFELRGKATLLTVVSSWLPAASQQLKIIEDFSQRHPQVNAVAVMTQEKPAAVSIYAKRGNYTIPIVTDPDGIILKELELNSFPAHIFMDRKGVIKKVLGGILDQNQLTENLLN